MQELQHHARQFMSRRTKFLENFEKQAIFSVPTNVLFPNSGICNEGFFSKNKHSSTPPPEIKWTAPWTPSIIAGVFIQLA